MGLHASHALEKTKQILELTFVFSFLMKEGNVTVDSKTMGLPPAEARNAPEIVGNMEKVRFVCAAFDNGIGEGFAAAMVSVSFLILTDCCL
jgi:hypothetical protein